MHGDCQAICPSLRILSCVAWQLALCRCESSHRLYQHRWACYHRWCSDAGHSVSSPSISKLADFLLFLQKEKHLSVSAIHGYHSTLFAAFKYRLSDNCTNFASLDLLRPFELERPSVPVGPPSWDLVKVLEYLCSPVFEPLSSKPLRIITSSSSSSTVGWDCLCNGCFCSPWLRPNRWVSFRPFCVMWCLRVLIFSCRIYLNSWPK